MKVDTAEVGPYYVGDQPATPALIVLDGDLTGFSNVDVKLTKPDHTTQILTGIGTIQDDSVLVNLAGGYFTNPGIWKMALVLTGSGVKTTIPGVRFVVDQDGDWHSLASAREDWDGAPDNDVQLYTLLEIAKDACLTYGPSLAQVDDSGQIIWDDPELPSVPSGWVEDPYHPGYFYPPDTQEHPPLNFVQAQLMHARNLWNAAIVDPNTGQQGGPDTYVITPRPLDWHVQQLLRPKTGDLVVL